MLKSLSLQPIKNWFIHQGLYIFIQLLIVFIVSYCILSVEITRQVGLAFRYGFTSILIPCSIILTGTFQLRGIIWKTASFCAVLLLFTLPLSGLWTSGAGEKTIIAGLLPWSDANAYYISALKLSEGIQFSGIASRRTFFPGLLATLLWASNNNLQISLVIMTIVAAISCYLLTREIQRVNGTLAAVFLLVFLFFYHRRFTGTTMSENLGLPLGVLGFAMLWKGIREKKNWILLTGFFFITLALNTRAGAFFILPALVIWYITLQNHHTFQNILKHAIVAVIPIISGFLIYILMFNLLSSPDSQPFSNFSYTLYGTVSGGVGWEQVLHDHPELRLLDTEEFNHRCYQLAFEAFNENPTGIITGSFRSLADFFSLKDIGVFGYLKTDSQILSEIIRLVMLLLGGIGLFTSFKEIKNPHNRLIFCSFIGIILSIPFAPPIDAEEMRAYAATISFLGILPVFGLSALLSKIKPVNFLLIPEEVKDTQTLIPFSILLAFLIIFVPVVILNTSHAPQLRDIKCPPGQDAVYIRYSPGSTINIVEDNDISSTWLPNIEWSKYDRSIHDSMHSYLVSEFTGFDLPFTIINAPDLKSWKQVWLFIDSQKLPQTPATIGVCGKWSAENPDEWIIQAMTADSVETISIP